MVVHTCNSSTEKAKADCCQVWVQPACVHTHTHNHTRYSPFNSILGYLVLLSWYLVLKFDFQIVTWRNTMINCPFSFSSSTWFTMVTLAEHFGQKDRDYDLSHHFTGHFPKVRNRDGVLQVNCGSDNRPENHLVVLTQQPQILKANTSERNVPARNAAEEPLEVYHRWKGLRSGHLDTKLSPPEDEAHSQQCLLFPPPPLNHEGVTRCVRS